jgi:predicted nucleotidyltransferase
MDVTSQPPRVRRALAELAAALRQRWGDELVALRLFGSRARGQADAASDVDVAVVLERAGWAEKCAVIDLAADVGLAHDLLLSPTVFDRETYERWRRQARPLVSDIEREGIPL